MTQSNIYDAYIVECRAELASQQLVGSVEPVTLLAEEKAKFASFLRAQAATAQAGFACGQVPTNDSLAYKLADNVHRKWVGGKKGGDPQRRCLQRSSDPPVDEAHRPSHLRGVPVGHQYGCCGAG